MPQIVNNAAGAGWKVVAGAGKNLKHLGQKITSPLWRSQTASSKHAGIVRAIVKVIDFPATGGHEFAEGNFSINHLPDAKGPVVVTGDRQDDMFGDQLVEVVRTDDEEESTSSFDSAENSKEAPVPRFSRWIHIHNYASDDVPAIAQKYLLHEITQADLIAVPRRSFASHRAHVFAVLHAPPTQGLDHVFCFLINEHTLLTCTAYLEQPAHKAKDPVERSVSETNGTRSAKAFIDSVMARCETLKRPPNGQRLFIEVCKAVLHKVWLELEAFSESANAVNLDERSDSTSVPTLKQLRVGALTILNLQRDATWLLTRYAEPWGKLATELGICFAEINGKGRRSTSKLLLREFSAQVEQMKSTLASMRSESASSFELVNQDIQLRMNQTMYTLTVVSIVFMPLSFISGVYGMNFAVIPELEWELGYVYFWGLEIGITILGSLFLYWLYH